MRYRFNKIPAALLLIPVLLLMGCGDTPTGPIAESPFVWVAGDLTVLKSADAGESWLDCVKAGLVPITLLDQSYRSLSFSGTLWGSLSGNNCWTARTANSVSWSPVSPENGNATYHASVMLDSNTLYVCGDRALLYRITGTDIKWIAFYLSAGGNPFGTAEPDFYGLDFIDASTGWVVGENSALVFTADNGKNWKMQTTEPGRTYRAVQIYRNNASERSVWIAGDSGTVYKTTDMGAHWTRLPTGSTAYLTSLCVADDKTAYFAGREGVILKTGDNGATFSLLNSGTGHNLNSISFIDAQTGFAAGERGTLLRTTDGGITWTQLPWGGSSDLYGVACVKRFRNK